MVMTALHAGHMRGVHLTEPVRHTPPALDTWRGMGVNLLALRGSTHPMPSHVTTASQRRQGGDAALIGHY